MIEKDRLLSKKDARAVGIILGLSTFVAINAAPSFVPNFVHSVSDFIEKAAMSTNINDYSVVTEVSNVACYTEENPMLSDALKVITFHDVYCPAGINGETKFVELKIPTDTITKYPEIK